MNLSEKRRPLIASTGMYRLAFHNEENYVNSILEYFSKINSIDKIIDGIELNIRNPEVLHKLILSNIAIDLLQRFHYNTLHFFYTDTFFYKDIYSSKPLYHHLHFLNSKFNFNNITIHPFSYSTSGIESLISIIKNDIGIPIISVENMFNDLNENFENLLNFKDISFLYDIAHAQVCNLSKYPDMKYKSEILKKYINKVYYIHISAVRSDIPYYDVDGKYCPHAGHCLFHETSEIDNKLLVDNFCDCFKENSFIGIILEMAIKEKNSEVFLKEVNFIKENILRIFN